MVPQPGPNGTVQARGERPTRPSEAESWLGPNATTANGLVDAPLSVRAAAAARISNVSKRVYVAARTQIAANTWNRLPAEAYIAASDGEPLARAQTRRETCARFQPLRMPPSRTQLNGATVRRAPPSSAASPQARHSASRSRATSAAFMPVLRTQRLQLRHRLRAQLRRAPRRKPSLAGPLACTQARGGLRQVATGYSPLSSLLINSPITASSPDGSDTAISPNSLAMAAPVARAAARQTRSAAALSHQAAACEPVALTKASVRAGFSRQRARPRALYSAAY